ncbi:MAG TPA: VCBS repeat-containing protein [Polyangiaceae bacterium]|jgi:hypothetical protein
MRLSPIAFAGATACALSCVLFTNLDDLGPARGDAGDPEAGDAFVDAPVDASAIAAPRPRAPLAGTYATSQKPIFSWVLPPGVDGAHVDICADRACSIIEQQIDQSGSSGQAALLAHGVHYWRVRGRVGSTVGVATSATWEVGVPRRSAPHDASYGGLSDFDGDGYSDLVASINAFAPHSLAFFAGSKAGIGSAITFVDPKDSAHDDYARLTAGDVDGDGFADLIAAVPRQSGDTSATIGRVSIYAGSDAAFGASATPKYEIAAPAGADRFGVDVAYAGDLDGDGFGDLAVAATLPSNGGMRVFLYFGHANGPSAAPDVVLDTPKLGGTLAANGDLDGDGHSDLFVWGAAATATASAVFLGAAGGPSDATMHPLSTPSDATTNFGIGSASVGDLDGDGLVDWVVSDLVAPPAITGLPGPGTAYVYFGATDPLSALQPATTLVGEGVMNENFGESSGVVGDVDGDGYDDLVVGTVSAHNGAGRAFFFPGGTSGPSNASRVELTGDGQSFGVVGQNVGDLNGDGYADVAIGGLGAPYVRVYYGGASGISDTSTPQNKLALGGDLYGVR